jgi:hypothetical protein
MTRQRLAITLLVAAAATLFVAWIDRYTYWDDLRVPMPLKGEARVDPFYAARRFAEELGARTAWDRMIAQPPADAVIVLSGWHWSLATTRRAVLQQWVESGGRLVVDRLLADPAGDFERWSGIVRKYPETVPARIVEPFNLEQQCRSVIEEFAGRHPSGADDGLRMCDLGVSWLETRKTPEWALRDDSSFQAMRVRVGRGSVTVINAAPFRGRALFDGDHGRVFAAAAQLRRADNVHFLSEDDYPSLLALTWRYGAPVVTISLALVAAVLWRGALRFGPLAPAPLPSRRSLADQIRGSGRFALRHGSGAALHAACVRALDEAAGRRVGGYATLTSRERVAAVARLTGVDRDSLAAAIHDSRWRTPGNLHRTLALLELARRQTLITNTRREHGIA